MSIDFTLKLIGRDSELFEDDVKTFDSDLKLMVENSKFLVIGGAGSIGQAVVKEIFKRDPQALHVIDISENNLVELVRDVRSSLGYIKGDFRTYALDCTSSEYKALIKSRKAPYDYILNLSALKHVRSEKDPYTLMRLLRVNIFNADALAKQAIQEKAKKYFCVSTDKAANPVNMMGASKRIMEMFMMKRSLDVKISMARFANVAFSDGSLLHGFNQRIQKKQPIAAPQDVKRYFVTPKESGELCLMSCLMGENRDVFFPKLSEKLHLISFAEIAVKYLKELGYEPLVCKTEEEARARVSEAAAKKLWPCYFFDSDTTGEKDFEEFFTDKETLDMEHFKNIGVIKNEPVFDEAKLNYFVQFVDNIKKQKEWNKGEFISLFNYMIPEFKHKEMNKDLDQKM